MSQSNSFLKSLVVAAAVALAGVAHAGGGGAAGGGSTEWTQIANNAELVKVSADSALTARTTVDQYLIQIEQYRNQLLNMKGLDPVQLAVAIADAKRAYDNVTAYRAALGQLNGSLQNQQSAFNNRFTEAKLLGLTWDAYVKRSQVDAQNNNNRAIARLQSEENIMNQVQSDYEYAHTQYEKIPTALGVEQSIQILNSQMNRLITQNAQLTAILAKAHNTDVAVKEASENNARVNARTAYDRHLRMKQAMKDRQVEESGASK